MSGEQMESAMATLEDADDVQALRGAQKEAADELLEFDETIEYNKDADPDAETDPQQPAPPVDKEKDEVTDANEEQKKEEEELEKEFATWQSKVGMVPQLLRHHFHNERYGAFPRYRSILPNCCYGTASENGSGRRQGEKLTSTR
jgi:hypothetical protein